ncbi:hypothetical protein AAFF_G00416340 [Aldrovandia affinis]|uniref:Uncharacterized protein n=1 Tax=Aldrovandia affinis TaxID=143900 RepID=A0AAD7WJ93_9TELE|nr:hypothetical protein AAFF_G00416340 [Aldrovandia affinis]
MFVEAVSLDRGIRDGFSFFTFYFLLLRPEAIPAAHWCGSERVSRSPTYRAVLREAPVLLTLVPRPWTGHHRSREGGGRDGSVGFFSERTACGPRLVESAPVSSAVGRRGRSIGGNLDGATAIGDGASVRASGAGTHGDDACFRQGLGQIKTNKLHFCRSITPTDGEMEMNGGLEMWR